VTTGEGGGDRGGGSAVDVMVIKWASSSPFAPPEPSDAGTVTRVSSMTVRDATSGCDVPLASLFSPPSTAASPGSECDVFYAGMTNASDVAAVIVWSEVVLGAVPGAAASSLSRMACRYWSESSTLWSSMGVSLVGFRNVSGRLFLGCASLHLTAFAGMQLSSDVTVTVNTPELGMNGRGITVRVMRCVSACCGCGCGCALLV
jgi:hypothetical protein